MSEVGLAAKAVVIVATARSLKMNGGVARSALDREDISALLRGCENLGRHIENMRLFGVPVLVAINHFVHDTDAEIGVVRSYAEAMGVEAVLCRHWADGSAGTAELARLVVDVVERNTARSTTLYDDDLPLIEKIRMVAQRIYRAETISADKSVLDRLERWQAEGFGALPVCMAKTQYSFSTDPTHLGAPTGHDVRIRAVRLAAGAGFIVAICGDILSMPGLPRHPAAEGIGVDSDGEITGLF